MGNLVERKIKSRCLVPGRQISFHRDLIELPNGRRAIREYMRHIGAVTVIPFLDRERIIMLRQYRYPVGKTIMEIPAGKLDPGEKPITCARRELLEETGYWPGKIKKITDFWPTPAFATEVMHIYAAWDLEPRKVQREEDEFLEPFVVKFNIALDWVRKGRIRDAKTIIALLYLKTFKPIFSGVDFYPLSKQPTGVKPMPIGLKS